MVRLNTSSPWLLGFLAALELSGSFVRAETGQAVPGLFIVEYEDGVNVDAETANIDGVAETRMKLDFELFKGASIRFEDVNTADIKASTLVETNKAIKNVWPVRKYALPSYTVHWTGSEETNDDVAAAMARQTSSDTFSTHVMTQVNKLRDEGVVGTGIKVAVIDSGIDYLHPALGGCFGAGCLVSHGYDFVGDDYTGANTPVADPDPLDCGGHGTHVAGIIAAQTNNPFGIIGAATGVDIGAYRVFGCEGYTSDDVLIAAYNMAYESGADLITASIGGVSGWPADAWSTAVARIVAKGVPCLLSAGNDGDKGLFYTAAAAQGHGVTSIASLDNSLGLALMRNASYTIEGSESSVVDLQYTAGIPSNWADVTLPLYALTFNTSVVADACTPLPDDTPDLSGYIVLIRRGTCGYAVKLANVAAFGAKYAIVYNNVPYGTPKVVGDSVPGFEAAAAVVAKQGATWIAALQSGLNVTVSMTDPNTTTEYLIEPINDASGGTASTYTTWGPTFEVDSKPQLAAPGGLILSTYPTKDGSYAVLSGTSMACPLAAGIYAVLMSATGIKDPKTLENLLASTAKPNVFNNGTAFFDGLAPTVQQGAGLIQLYDAVHVTSRLSVSSLAFNDTDNFAQGQEFSIENNSNDTVTYTIRDVNAATAYTFAPGAIYPAPFPNSLDSKTEGASLAFDVESPFTIPAGGRQIIHVNCTPPATLDSTRLPVYSGYVVINGSDSSALSLPYMGVAGSMKAATVLDPEATYLTGSEVINATAVGAGRTFYLPPAGASNDTTFQSNSTEYPRFQFALAMGSALIRLEVSPVGEAPAGTNVTQSLGITTIGDVFGTPMTYYPRMAPGSVINADWDGRLATGAYAPEGSYKLVLRALKILGDRDNADDYEAVETVDFNIKYLSSSAAGLTRRASGPAKRVAKPVYDIGHSGLLNA